MATSTGNGQSRNVSTDIVLQKARQSDVDACQHIVELKTASTLCRHAKASILVAFSRLEKPEEGSSAQGQATYDFPHVSELSERAVGTVGPPVPGAIISMRLH